MSQVYPVRIKNAHKYYNKGRSNELHVIDGTSLDLPESGLVAIFGRSGCGKTTLLNAVGGLDSIDAGSIELFGEALSRCPDLLRNRYIGYIFQNYNLNVNETVYENVAAALRLCGLTHEEEIAERVRISLANVGLEKYSARTPDTLSGGQQQRVAIARALVKSPAIILADEPTGNLDEANTVMVMDILKTISKNHLVLLVTHEENLVDHYCDRVIEIADGKIVADRENQNAGGYVRRDKNDIYLGELPLSETEAPGVRISYYGTPAEPLHLRIVHLDGKLYLKSDDPKIKLLEEGSEIRLVEGVFNETPAKDTQVFAAGEITELASLPPADEKSYGRLYHPKNAAIEGFRENFSKKRKKSNRRLRVCLILLAIVMVFMTAAYGAGIRSYSDYSTTLNENVFYVPLDPALDQSKLNGIAGEHGVDHTCLIGGDPAYDGDVLSFKTAAFVTANASTLQTDRIQAQSDAWISGKRIVAGTTDIKNPAGDVIITTAVADAMLEDSPVSYIDSYEDLIGLRGDGYGYAPYLDDLRIVGVVESDEFFYYMDALRLADRIIGQYFWYSFARAGKDSTLKPGEIAYVKNEEWTDCPYKQGDTVTIMGLDFKLAEIYTFTEEDRYDEEGDLSDLARLEDCFILTERDYIAITQSVGVTRFYAGDETYMYNTYDYGYGDPDYSNHLLIHSSDPAATAVYLTELLGRDGFLSPEDILADNLSDQRGAITAAVVSVLVVLALMCLCVFFIMRSSFMSRVREVGILRAIGVTKRNLIFRFGVETAILILLTLLPGYVISAAIIASLSDTLLFTSVFFLPLWLSGGLLCVVLAASMVFGVLPAVTLLSRTPSEILSKYDI